MWINSRVLGSFRFAQFPQILLLWEMIVFGSGDEKFAAVELDFLEEFTLRIPP